MSGVYELLVKFDPHGLRDAAKAWKALGHAVDTTGQRHRNQVNGPLQVSNGPDRPAWEGADATAARPYMVKTEVQMEIIRMESEAAALVLNTVAERMYQAQTNLINAVNRAVDAGLTVSGEGVITMPPPGKGEANDPEAQKARQQLGSEMKGFQDRIDAALKAAQTASDQGHSALVSLSANTLDPSREAGSLLTAKNNVAGIMRELDLVDPYMPDGKDPARNATWWKSLTPEQQETYITLDAARVGNLDGIPADARDRANRLVLDQKIDALEAGSASVFGLDQEAYDKRKATLKDIRTKLEESANERNETKQMFLLAIDPEAYGGDGRAIVATGNPDKASHTAVWVPGTGTELPGMPDQINRIRQFQRTAERQAGAGETVSVISYLGYDTPESIPEAGNPMRGVDGAEDMRRFSNGLRVAHGEPKTHLTWMAHSYGTFALGEAAKSAGGLHADDILALGSPGMGLGVIRAEQLNIDPEHVWIGTSTSDPIRVVSGTVLGSAPHIAGFGGNNIKVDTSGHAGYWTDDSESLKNIGKIIAKVPPTTGPKEDPLWGNIPH
ncbi:alpha/beta hydrolase [Kitasatospora sp. NPDC096140]|uniref:alpha/beta hydrolase n=1 Tax=Kitasatospora sp. NPDC096140 TaxID=3155425 RepID=UPI00331BD0FD